MLFTVGSVADSFIMQKLFVFTVDASELFTACEGFVLYKAEPIRQLKRAETSAAEESPPAYALHSGREYNVF